MLVGSNFCNRSARLLQEESRVVIIRFGHDWDQVCMQMDEVSYQMGTALLLAQRTPPLCYAMGNAFAAEIALCSTRFWLRAPTN